MIYDLIIIGGGPAGVAAGIYGARKKIKNVLIAESIGGQSVVAAEIQNWIGEKSISGVELAKKFKEHLKEVGQEIILGEEVVKIEKLDQKFSVETNKGKKIETKTVILANGSRRRHLNVPGEEKFIGKGVSFCATCDAPLFQDVDVAVIGAGNAGLQAILELSQYAKKLYLLTDEPAMRGDKILQEKILTLKPKIDIIYNTDILEIKGDKFVSSLAYKNKISGETKEISVAGVFIEIGSVPNSDLVKHLVDINEQGQVIVDHKTQATSIEGIFAAGDVTDNLYSQNNIAAGDGIKALLSVEKYLHKIK